MPALCAGVCAGAEATDAGSKAKPVISSQLKDVPFRAMQVIVRRGAGGVVETRGRVARNSEGSTYVELIDEGTKEPAEVLIFDVPHRRRLVLDVKKRSYRVVKEPALKGKEAPLDFSAEQLRVGAMLKNSSVREVRDGMESTWTGLGVKRLGGLETVGSLQVRRPLAARGEVADGPAEMDESWVSIDLGIAVQRTRHDPMRGEDTELTLTEIVRTEPDAALFAVPAGYVPEGARAELRRPVR